jgi:GMP reductase
MDRELYYKDVLLLPNYSIVESRNDIKTTVFLGSMTFELPVVAANMRSVISEDLAVEMATKRYFYIMHRFGVDNIKFCRMMGERKLYTSISVGVNQESKSIISELAAKKIYPSYVCIDIAHGYAVKMRDMIVFIKHVLPKSFIIAGNVCTSNAVTALDEWGADAIKVGTSGGRVCSTKTATGFARPQFSAVLECSKATSKPVIADGGVAEIGDINKALCAGASMVMCGNLFSSCEESPGDTFTFNGIRYKSFYGSASEHMSGKKEYIEGFRIDQPVKGSIWDVYKRINDGVRSAVSYAGGTNLGVFKNVRWVTI